MEANEKKPLEELAEKVEHLETENSMLWSALADKQDNRKQLELTLELSNSIYDKLKTMEANGKSISSFIEWLLVQELAGKDVE